MPKILNYPLSSLDKCIEMAEAIYSLGESTSKDLLAEKLGVSAASGNFSRYVSSATKFKLIKSEHGKIVISQLYKQIKLSYSDTEKIQFKREAFLSPTVFHQLYEKLKGKELPKDILPKMLVREFSVEEGDASKVSKHFTEGLNQLNLIENNVIKDSPVTKTEQSQDEIEDESSEEKPDLNKQTQLEVIPHRGNTVLILDSESYTIQFTGPGLNTRIEIQEEDDLLIVEATINKIRRKLSKTGS